MMLPWGRDDRLLIEQIKRFITTAGRRPFFLVGMTSNPHHPYAVDHLPSAPEVANDTGRSAYERLVEYDVGLVIELYDWMKQRGDRRAHARARPRRPWGSVRRARRRLRSCRVHLRRERPHPVLHPASAAVGSPRRIAQLGSQVDLRATIMDIIGMHDTEPSDGMSLLRTDPDRQVINFTENGVSHFGVRDTRFSYIYTPQVDSEQVFDRSADPQEARNIAALDPLGHGALPPASAAVGCEHQLSLARVLH